MTTETEDGAMMLVKESTTRGSIGGEVIAVRPTPLARFLTRLSGGRFTPRKVYRRDFGGHTEQTLVVYPGVDVEVIGNIYSNPPEMVRV